MDRVLCSVLTGQQALLAQDEQPVTSAGSAYVPGLQHTRKMYAALCSLGLVLTQRAFGIGTNLEIEPCWEECLVNYLRVACTVGMMGGREGGYVSIEANTVS